MNDISITCPFPKAVKAALALGPIEKPTLGRTTDVECTIAGHWRVTMTTIGTITSTHSFRGPESATARAALGYCYRVADLVLGPLRVARYKMVAYNRSHAEPKTIEYFYEGILC